MKTIAIIVQNIIQWYTIKPLIELLSKKPVILDILVYNPETKDTGFINIEKSLRQTIKEEGYLIKSKPREKGYHITLAPYSNMITFRSKFRLGYCYGAATTKPNLTLLPEFKKGFHGMFLHDIYGAELFGIYGRTYIVPYLYLNGYQHKQPSRGPKPTILFLPTYREKSTIKTALSLMQLKDKYRIIVKSHHGTDYLTEENETHEVLNKIAEETYNSSQFIVPLMKKADLVLSDNSGATMDAFYSKTPVAIAAFEINNGFPGINTLQYQLVKEGVFPYTNNPTPENLSKIIELGLLKTQQEKQAKKSEEIFPNKKGGANEWYKVLKLYLDDEIDQNYYKIHDYLEKNISTSELEKQSFNREISILNTRNEALAKKINTLENKLALYENSRAHRTIEKILKFKR